MDERKALMQAVGWRALAYRVNLSALCARAGLSRTIAYRWKWKDSPPTLPTIGKLERALDEIERERAGR